MPTEHDRLFKTLLRTFFPGFLGLVVPDLAERLDATRASFLDKEFLAAEPAGKREADLVARVPVRNDGVLLVHVEIEARAGSRMPYRLRAYAGRIQAAYGILLLDFVEAYLGLTPPEAAAYKVLSARNRRRARAMLMRWSERLKEEGKREGLKLGEKKGLKLGEQRGLKLGKQEGLQEGARSLQQVLLRLLDQRFGPLPESVHRQVEAINSLRRLTRLAEQVLTVGSLRELRLR